MSIEQTAAYETSAHTALPKQAMRARLWSRVGNVIGVPLWVPCVGFLAWLATFILVWRAGAFRSYGDALSHELIARRVLDSLNPGLAQLGTVWLPLPPLLLAPLVAFDPLWRLGIAGALLGALYLQLTLGALYRFGRQLGGTTVGALAVVAFLANPNTLYLFVVPLTEAAALTFACLCSTALAETVNGFKNDELRLGALLRTSVWAAAALLCRYDSWLFAFLVGVVLLVAGLLWLRDWEKIEAAALFYAVIPIAAMALWFFYNWAIFGDPLAFQHGLYSSSAIVHDLATRGIIPTIAGQPPEEGNPLRAATTYGQAVLENSGIESLVLAVVGLIVALVSLRRRQAALALIPLLAPFVFYIIALSQAQSVIVTRTANPNGIFNIRYGSTLAPCIALGIAALVLPLERKRWYVVVPLGVTVVLAGILLLAAPGGPVTVAEGTLQTRAITASAAQEAAHWLTLQPPGGLILLDDALQPQAQTIVTYGDRPLRRYITSSNPAEWAAALNQPSPDVTWIVTLGPTSRDRPNDRVGKALLLPGDTIVRYTKVFDNSEIMIFRRDNMASNPIPHPTASQVLTVAP